MGRVGFVLVPELHADQVDDAREFARLPGGNGAHGRNDVELFLHLLDAIEEVGPHAVELVDEGDARHAMPVGLVPDGFALHLDAADGAEDAHRPVEDAQRTFHLRGEVDVAGRVDQGDARVAPLDGDGCAVDRDALGLFERIEVRGGVAVIDVAGLVLGTAKVEDPLCGGGLAGVHVGDDADIAKFFEHGYSSNKTKPRDNPLDPSTQSWRLFRRLQALYLLKAKVSTRLKQRLAPRPVRGEQH